MEEQVRRLYEPFARGDLDGLLEQVTDDVEWLSPPGGIPGLEAAYHGKDGIRRWFGDLREGWDQMMAQADAVEEVGPGIALVTVTMHGRAGGAETAMPVWHVIRFVDDRAALLAVFFDRQSAMAAAQDLKTERPG
jgi:ketosteroid isomerase-like protein